MPFWFWLLIASSAFIIIGFIIYAFTRKKPSVWPWIFVFIGWLLLSAAIAFIFLEFRHRPAHYTTPGEAILSAVPQEYLPPALTK